MPKIHLTTFIPAPVERVFNLSRNISLHKISMSHTGEEAIAGITSGQINLHESVTWKARHFFKTRYFTSLITEMQPYEKFTDKMIKGDFRSFRHDHFFKKADNGTLVIDIVEFKTPYGILGQLVNQLFMKRHIEKLLKKRNDTIRQYATGDRWKAVLVEK